MARHHTPERACVSNPPGLTWLLTGQLPSLYVTPARQLPEPSPLLPDTKPCS
jgi:hypothetical protein